MEGASMTDIVIINKLPRSLSQKSQNFKDIMAHGMAGKNVGIEYPSKEAQRWLHGVGQARYYLMGADSGVGKTTIGDFMFVLNSWYQSKRQKIPFDCTYFSFEIGENDKRARWLSFFIFMTYGIRLPSEYLLGRNSKMLMTKEHWEMSIACLDQLDELMDEIHFLDNAMNPTGVFHHMIEHAKTLGEIQYEKFEDPKTKEPKQRIAGFKPKHPQQISLMVIDHIALLHEESGNDTKKNIDTMSKYCVFLRNKLMYSQLIIQQFNTELASIERQKFKQGAIAPQRTDFGDSKYTYRDADVVFGLIKPNQFDLEDYCGYDVSKFRDYLVMMFLMKNRYGPTNKRIPLVLDPVAGMIYDVSKDSGNMLLMEQHYDFVDELDKVQAEFSQV